MKAFRVFLAGEAGQDLVEYALLASFIALVSLAALLNLGTVVSDFFRNVEAQLQI